MTRRGHVPERTCIACRRPQAKGVLLRLVRAATGEVSVDSGGRLAGRGAYLCSSWTCWEDAFRKGRVEHALRTNLSPSAREHLLEEGKALVGLALSEEA